RQLALVGRQRAQDLEAGDDVQAAVEPAAVRDRVQVSADDDEALRVAGGGGPEVPGRVAVDGDAVDARQLLAEPVVGGLPGVGPGDALRSVLVSGEAPELSQSLDRPRGVDLAHVGNLAARGRRRARLSDLPGSPERPL